MAGLTLISKLPSISPSFLLASRSAASRSLALHRASPLLRYRPLLSLAEPRWLPNGLSVAAPSLRCFSTRPTTSSLNDPSPNWSNRPPKETILLDGCDFEHWLVVMEPPDPNLTRDEIIDSYIKTLSQIVGSEDEARMKIYSVSTKHYFAFGALISEELSYKMKTVANVRWVLPDSYLDVRNKDYGGEPFIDGKAVPYDPKYHEEWVRNNARANERSRRNDRPRNYDRSRNFERRRENMQTFQNRDAPPNQAQNPMPPRDGPPMPPRDGPPMPPRDGPPMPGSNVQNRDMPPVPPNRDFNAAPLRNMPPVPNHEGMPNTQSSYIPNRDGGSGYQGGGQGYQGGNPGGGIQGGQGYQGGNPGGSIQGGQGYQGGNPGGGIQGGQGYQGGNPMGGMQGGQGYQGGNPGGSPAYQGGGQGYQPGPGGGPGYQGGGPGYQGGGPGYQPGGPGYQGSGPGYQPGGPGYQGGGPNYQRGGPGYQGGGPSYQPDGPSNQGGGAGYQGGGPGYQGRDIPGRD